MPANSVIAVEGEDIAVAPLSAFAPKSLDKLQRSTCSLCQESMPIEDGVVAFAPLSVKYTQKFRKATEIHLLPWSRVFVGFVYVESCSQTKIAVIENDATACKCKSNANLSSWFP